MAVETTTKQEPAPDQPARDRIAHDLDSTLFVEAGAGSGKTTNLVTRVVNLVTSGSVEMREIAAVTFTEKAAMELRDRVRQELERRAASGDDEVATRCRTAADQLDSAAVGTLHSFAQRILSENPVEAGLPPRVEVLDEVSSAVEFDRRWTTFRDALLGDPALERTLLMLFASGVRPEALRIIAGAFDDNWDLVEERVPAEAPDPSAVAPMVAPVLDELEAVCDLAQHCGDENDKLFARVEEIRPYVHRLRDLSDDADLLEALDLDSDLTPDIKGGKVGQKPNWACDIDDVRDRLAAAGSELRRIRAEVAGECAVRVASAMRSFTLAAARERRVAGRLEFHDLLVLARAVLRDPRHGAAVRTRLHRRYRRLLLDEFQDTDPIQIELAVRIAAERPEAEESGTLPWYEVPVAPGHLFVVGDPKQSIYRFRRADISTFLDARERFGLGGGQSDGLVELTANFRSGAGLIEWVNSVFARLMSEEPELLLPVKSRPEYVPLEATRASAGDTPVVRLLGREEHPSSFRAADLRRAEAADVAAAVATALHERWQVFDDGTRDWRDPRLGDITILVPARTSLPFLEDSLERAGIPYRAESSSLVYGTRAIRDLLMVLRAVADPTDHLRIVSALRTPLFACGDDDLFRFKVLHNGRWSYLAEQPASVPEDDPVALGLAYLRSLYDQRYWRAPSELLDQIARDRFAFELGFVEGRPRDVWRRLRFVIDQARAWADSAGGTLRDYLHWVTQQTAEGARVAEAVLPETDDDAVRIMTIHAAKGLEFPITILSGMSTAPKGWTASAEVTFPASGPPGYKLGKQVKTPEYDDWKPIDEQMGFDERIRLLYVASTRARDHLVVSLHRPARKNPPVPRNRTNAELLAEAMRETNLLDVLPDAVSDATVAAPVGPAPVAAVEPPPFDEWLAERQHAIAAMSRPTTFAATALTDEGALDADDVTHGLQKRPRDLDLPPWLRGRYGSAIGRAVHGVLQVVDLSTGNGLEPAVAAQCEAEAVVGKERDVRRLAEEALASPSVREAAAGAHWREIYACAPVSPGGRLVEGYIDLLYRNERGNLVVVDYKTSATAERTELDRRVEGYRMQGAAYALTVAATTGESVERVTFVFLTPEGAIERNLDDLDAAIAAVRAAVERGDAVEVDEL